MFCFKTGIHVRRSSLYGFISVRIYLLDGLDRLATKMKKLLPCSNGLVNCNFLERSTSPFFHQTQEENYYRTGDCYQRYASSCVVGCGVPTWCVPYKRQWAFSKIVKSVTKSSCLLNFSFKCWWINLISLNITFALYSLPWIWSNSDIYIPNYINFFWNTMYAYYRNRNKYTNFL